MTLATSHNENSKIQCNSMSVVDNYGSASDHLGKFKPNRSQGHLA